METAAELISRERRARRLSIRDLATLAGLSYPTISRIEQGHEQPRFETMQRIALALGRSFTFADEEYPCLAGLAAKFDAPTEPNWTLLRGFVDQIRLRPAITAVATLDAPRASGSAFVDNLLAATAEKLTDDAGIRRPRWTKQITPLSESWSAPTTAQRRASDIATTPSQFASRNITLPASAIWRDRELAL